MIFSRFFSVLLIVILCFTACGTNQNTISPQENTVSQDEEAEETDINIPESPTIPQIKNPLNGLYMNKEYENQRPLAVMIENESKARPQSGLDKADVVYEILTEGGITRFLALYLGNQCTEIGPVRSSRPYFLDFAMEYDGIYVHYGASTQAYTDLKKLKLDAIDGIYDTVTFWRDKSRREPHNAYTESSRILTTSEKRGYIKTPDFEPWQFSDKEATPLGDPLNKMKLTYFNNYSVSYTYDDERKAYKRYINGKPHTDRTTQESIYVTNIIVQFLNTKVIDDEGKLKIDTTGSGKAYYISHGYVQEIQWKKESRSGRTYYTVDGKDLYFNPGNIWIQIMPQWGAFEKGEI